jgi:hypothetical protein
MPDSEETSIQQDISGALADAMVRAGKSTAVLITMAMDDGTIWNFSAGTLIEKLGLIKAVELRAREYWGASEPPTSDEDK